MIHFSIQCSTSAYLAAPAKFSPRPPPPPNKAEEYAVAMSGGSDSRSSQMQTLELLARIDIMDNLSLFHQINISLVSSIGRA
jgi:hypothetical protein